MADSGNFSDTKYPHFNTSYTQSEPHTPINHIPAPGSNPYENVARFGSVSSIATTDDDDATNEIQYAWTSQQDQLVCTAYDEYTKMPQTTPFSGRYVPSGAVNRVAKNAFKLAKKHQVHFPHSINAVRHRVGTLFNPEPENMEELQQISAPDYFSMIPHGFSGSEAPLPRDLTAHVDEFNFFDNSAALRRLSVEEKYAHKLTPTNLEDLSNTPRYNEPSLRGKHLEPSLVTRRGTNANNMGAYNSIDSPISRSPVGRSPINRSPLNRSPSNNSPKSWGGNGVTAPNTLAPPFKEPKPPILPPPGTISTNQMMEEEVINIVAKRKRDSLRMKRGQI